MFIASEVVYIIMDMLHTRNVTLEQRIQTIMNNVSRIHEDISAHVQYMYVGGSVNYV